MANDEQLAILQQGVDAWNNWRATNPNGKIDLRGCNLREENLRFINFDIADLRGSYLSKAVLCDANLYKANLRGADLNKADLRGADLRGANISRANLEEVDLYGADLCKANLRGVELIGSNLRGVDLQRVDLSEASLTGADLTDANLSEANLSNADIDDADLSRADLHRSNLKDASLNRVNLNEANLNEADLRGADLTNAALIRTNLEGANITDCNIYGIAAWGLNLKDTMQKNLIITPRGEPVLTVDDLEVAQFIYLLLNSDKMRSVIDTITSKTVLILGRFTPERKAVLEAIREELRKRDYVPLLFDFEKSINRDLRETVSTLAHIARFIIADITDAKSIPAELERVVPYLPSVPVMPLVLRSNKGYSLFDPLRAYPWVIEPYRYESQAELLASIVERVITPAEARVKERRKAGNLPLW